MRKRVISCLLITVLTLLTCAACGSKASPSTEGAETTAESSVKETTAATEKNEANEVSNSTDPKDYGADLNFDPQNYEDMIDYADLEKVFGPVPEPDKEISIGVLVGNLANEYWIVLSDGIRAGAEKYGVKVDVQNAMTSSDQAGSIATFDTLVNMDYDAYIVGPVADDLLVEQVAALRAAGKPVVNAVSNLQSNANLYIGNLHYENGYVAGQYIVDKLGGKGKVAMVMGALGMQNNTGRCDGFRAALEGTDVEIVAELPAEWSMDNAYNMAIDCLTANPDIEAFFCVNDNMALGVVEALRTKNMIGDVIVTGIDGLPAAYESIIKGELTATVEGYTTMVGEATVELVLRLLDGQEINRVVKTPLIMADINNYQEFYTPKE